MNLIYWVRANRLCQKLDDEKGLVLIAVLCLLAALVLETGELNVIGV